MNEYYLTLQYSMCLCAYVWVCVCMCACLQECVSVCTWTTVCVWLLLLDGFFVSSEIFLTKLSNLPACMKALFQWGGAANLSNSSYVWGILLQGVTAHSVRYCLHKSETTEYVCYIWGLYISGFIAFPENDLFKFSSCIFIRHGSVFHKAIYMQGFILR